MARCLRLRDFAFASTLAEAQNETKMGVAEKV